MNGSLSKPVCRDALLQVIATHLGASSGQMTSPVQNPSTRGEVTRRTVKYKTTGPIIPAKVPSKMCAVGSSVYLESTMRVAAVNSVCAR